MSRAATLVIDDPELVEWIKQNPLFKYRTEKPYALRNVASRLGRSQTTVSKWEDGSSYPTEENMKLIAKLMKLPLADLIKQWREWYEIKHSPEHRQDGNQKKDTNQS